MIHLKSNFIKTIQNQIFAPINFALAILCPSFSAAIVVVVVVVVVIIVVVIVVVVDVDVVAESNSVKVTLN